MNRAIEGEFPGLRGTRWEVTSAPTQGYNCIAWAAGDETAWWWPDPFDTYYWPPPVPRVEALGAFEAAFASLGYRRCLDGSIEADFEKIAIFADANGKPTHGARQKPDGTWTSKLGKQVDIKHDEVGDVSGAHYGSPAFFMKRPRR